MKKKRFIALMLLAMKISFAQLILAILFTFSLSAKDLAAQINLSKTIRLSVEKKEISKVLGQIQQQTGARFVYSSKAIRADRKISYTSTGTLGQFLEEYLKSLDIGYSILDDRILLFQMDRNKITASINEISGLENNSPQKIITGKVTTPDGHPLEGASIKIKDSNKGTTTDAQGNFKISVADGDKILIISFTGFSTVEIPIKNNKVIDVRLVGLAQSLDDVVVIGYGDKSKKKITTAISTVKGTEVNNLPVSTLGDALAAKVAGVQVTSAFGGQPGESPTIRIRGIGSLGADNSPLYVVDGYPLQSESNFANINPEDIESIEILKDAASAAIYGSRAANGVVIVTTKRGKVGKTRFNFAYITGMQQVAKKVDVLDGNEYRYYEPLLVAQRKGNARVLDTLNKYYPGTSTDWQDAILSSQPYNEAKLSASGGSNVARYNISAGYLNQPGVLLGTGAKRYTLRINIDAELSPKLKVGVNIAPSYTEQDRRPNGGNFNTSADGEYGIVVPSPIYTAIMMAPVIPIKLSDGRYAQPNFITGNDLFNTGMYNPVAVMENLTNHNTNFRTLGSGYLEWNIIKGLKYKMNAGGTLDFNRRQIYVSPNTPTTSSTTASFLNPNYNVIYAAEMKGRNIDWLVENTINYNKTFNKNHNLQVLLLQSAQKYTSSIDTVFGKSGSYTSTQITNPSSSADKGGGVAYDIFTFYSLAARINYDYKAKYLIDASIRQDGSSKFGSNNRFGVFNSLAVAWRISKENFMSQISQISELKLRASYGESGNANIGSFSWQSRLNGVNYSYGSLRQFGTVPAGYLNPNLTWEKNHQVDIGIELGLFKDRIYITADYYNKVTTDMILNKQLLSIVGYAFTYNNNTGNLKNTGFELGISTKNFQKKKFQWVTDFNISFNKNLVVDLGGAQNLGYYNAITGWNNVFLIKLNRPIGDMYGYQVDGIYKPSDDLTKVPQYGNGSTIAVAAGDMKIRDVNNDGVIDDNDKVVIGNSLPDFVAGMTNKITYGNVDFSFVLQMQKGGSIINGLYRNPWGTPGSNIPKEFYNNLYLDANAEANVKFPNVASKAPILFGNSLTSLSVYDASYLRLRSVTLGYTFPDKVLSKAKLQGLRLYLSSQNLFTITKYPGYNPEVSLNGNSITQPGVDQGVYPQVKNFVFGINVGF